MFVIQERTYRNVMIGVGVVAVMLLPFWPYSSWGYTPAIAAVAVLLAMLAMRTLARD